jgi:diguanylate cyclase (GGDEF)-like protein
MTPPIAAAIDMRSAAAPGAGLADSAFLALAGGRAPSADPWLLLRQALKLAAEAQQTVQMQRERIRYLENLSHADDLTGLTNRRGFEQALRQTLGLARRHKENGVLCYFDLDGFKQVNDADGHSAGDALLRRMGELLHGNVRGTDIVARLGGDEFAALLVRADPTEGRARALRLQRILNVSTATWSGKTLPIRVSMGVEVYGPEDEPGDLLRRADVQMYGNKRRRQAIRTGEITPAESSVRRR